MKHAAHRRPAPPFRTDELHGEYEFCCSLLKLAGFQVYRLSQARASRQSAGLPDLWAFHKGQGLELTMEVKRPATAEHRAGESSPAQTEFAEHRMRCRGYGSHITGDREALWTWLEFKGLATVLPGGEWAVRALGGKAVSV